MDLQREDEYKFSKKIKWCKVKELRSCHELKCANPYNFVAWTFKGVPLWIGHGYLCMEGHLKLRVHSL